MDTRKIRNHAALKRYIQLIIPTICHWIPHQPMSVLDTKGYSLTTLPHTIDLLSIMSNVVSFKHKVRQ